MNQSSTEKLLDTTMSGEMHKGSLNSDRSNGIGTSALSDSESQDNDGARLLSDVDQLTDNFEVQSDTFKEKQEEPSSDKAEQLQLESISESLSVVSDQMGQLATAAHLSESANESIQSDAKIVPENSQQVVDSPTSPPSRTRRRSRRNRNASNIEQGENAQTTGSANLGVSGTSEVAAVVEGPTYAERVRRKLSSSYPGLAASLASTPVPEAALPAPATTNTSVASVTGASTSGSKVSVAAAAKPLVGADTTYAQRLGRKQTMEPPKRTTADSAAALTTTTNAEAPQSSDSSHLSRMQRKQNSEQRMRRLSAVLSASSTSPQIADCSSSENSRTQSTLQVAPDRNLTCGRVPIERLPGRPSESTGDTESNVEDGSQTIHPSPMLMNREDWAKLQPTIADLSENMSTTNINLARMSARTLSDPGIEEGDQFFEAMFRGERPASINSDNIRTVHPAALQRHRPQDSYSFLPAESRGDFISGGQGPLVCDTMPGAFQAPGRAFGDLPAWFQNNPLPPLGSVERAAVLRHLSTRSLPVQATESSSSASPREDNFRELRMSMAEGSFIVRAQYAGSESSSNEATFNGLAVARATLLEKMASEATIEESEPEQSRELPERRHSTVVSPEDAAYEATAVDPNTICSAEEVTSEEVLRRKTAKLVFRFICGIVISLSLVLILLLVAFSVTKDVKGKTTKLPAVDSALFPRNESLPSRKTMCSKKPTTIYGDFSPVVECYCGREIPGIPAKIINAYTYFVRFLLAHGIINFPPLVTDCSDPKNLAILWMAEAVPETDRVEEIITRFLLALLFHSLGGLDWEDNTYWLTSRPGCAWYGVRCNSEYLIKQIQLADNELSGSIPSEVSDFADLRIFNIADNLNVSGEVPYQVDLLVANGRLKVDTNGTSVNLLNAGPHTSAKSNGNSP